MLGNKETELLDFVNEYIHKSKELDFRDASFLYHMSEIESISDVPAQLKVKYSRYVVLDENPYRYSLRILTKSVSQEIFYCSFKWSSNKSMLNLDYPTEMEEYDEVEINDIDWDDPELPTEAINYYKDSIDIDELTYWLEDFYEGSENIIISDFPKVLRSLIKKCLTKSR